MNPVVVIARSQVVMCFLHCCMALKRVQMANIEQLANDRLAPGDQATRAAIPATLHEHRTGCRPGKDACPDGEETSRIFAAWSDLACFWQWCYMSRSTRRLLIWHSCCRYNTCYVGPRPDCRVVAVAFRDHRVPGSVSHYLLSFGGG